MPVDQPLTLQDVFNHIYKEFVHGRRPKADSDQGCRYRGPNGEKCFIGMFIPDGKYSEQLEFKSLLSVEVQTALEGVFSEDIPDQVLQQLQDIHDDRSECDWQQGMENNLRKFAQYHALTIPKMSLQDVFNRVWREFVVDQKPRAMDNGRCFYRSPSGDACFIGVCIPDRMYSVDMEMRDVQQLFISFPSVIGEIFDESVTSGSLRSLQMIHDHVGEWSKLADHLREYADQHQLTVPE